MKLVQRLYNENAGLVEVPHLRGLQSKTFKLSNNQFKAVHTISKIHWYDTATQSLQDINLTPVDMGDHWYIDQAPYKLKVYKDSFKLDYESRSGGKSTIELTKIGNIPANVPNINISPVTQEDGIYYADILPGIDLHLRIGTGGIEWYKILHNNTTPKKFEWHVLEDKNVSFTHRQTPVGKDNKKRSIELNVNKLQNADVNGQKSFTYTEEFTGRIRKVVDPKTRIKGWATDAKYPVIIDVPDIIENVAAGADDGVNKQVYLSANTNSPPPKTTGFSFTTKPSEIEVSATANIWGLYAFGGIYYYTDSYYNVYERRVHPCFRFTTVNMPSAGVQVDLAQLKVNVTYIADTGMTAGSIKGIAEDNVAALTSGNQWYTKTKTTSSTPSGTINTTGIKTLDVTNQVQEIVDRPGWVTNNAVGMFLSAQTDINANRPLWTTPPGIGTTFESTTRITGAELEMYEAAGTSQATLEITYTLLSAPQINHIGI